MSHIKKELHTEYLHCKACIGVTEHSLISNQMTCLFCLDEDEDSRVRHNKVVIDGIMREGRIVRREE